MPSYSRIRKASPTQPVDMSNVQLIEITNIMKIREEEVH